MNDRRQAHLRHEDTGIMQKAGDSYHTGTANEYDPAHLSFRMIAPAFPTFNIYSRIARQTTALGPLMIATIASQMPAWNVEVIDENNFRKPGPKDENGRPDHMALQKIRHADVVGLYGGLTSTIPRLYELARFYKRQGVITVAGGQHFMGENIREALENGVDFVVVGEGENTIRDLLSAIKNKDLPDGIAGVAFMRDGKVVQNAERPATTDFESLPFANFGLIRYAKLWMYPINWVRGCGMNCEFCTVKGRARPASVRRIMDQIACLVETRNARRFFIVDDLFGQFRQDALRLCRMLTEYQTALNVRLNITVQIRLDMAKDAELLQAMHSAGINMVCIGYESPIQEELAAMNKKIRSDDMIALTQLYHKAGFFVHGMFIFGYPIPEGSRTCISATERVRQFRRFIKKARLDTIQVLLPVPLPGTELRARLMAQKRVFPPEIVGWEYYDGNFPLFQPDEPLSAEQMHAAIRRIMGRFYRFQHVFGLAINILLFPALVLPFFSFGWRRWCRSWRNAIVRSGGWITVRRWNIAFKRSTFSERMIHARKRLASTGVQAVASASTGPDGRSAN